MSNSEMRYFFDEQGRTRVFAEAYGFGTSQVETRGERRASEKESFLDEQQKKAVSSISAHGLLLN